MSISMAVTSVVVGVSLVVLSPNIARTRPRSNAYFPRWTVECFGENRPNRKAFSTSFSEMNPQNPFARAVVRQLERFRRQFRAYSGFLVFSFVFFLDLDSGEESGGARREDDGDLYREASKANPPPPFFPFFRIITSIPLATDVPRERFFFFFCRAVVVAVVVR